MPKRKKKLTKSERREVRLRKARQWALTYEGSHIVRAYRKRFRLDPVCALNDLREIGVLSPEKLAEMKRAEELRLEQKRREREQRACEALAMRFPDADDRFAFIAGYTSGGVPYGVTWEEMGISPWGWPDGEDSIE